jgi:transposase
MDQSVAVLALDIHKRFSRGVLLNRAGEVLEKKRLEHAARQEMRAWLEQLAEGTDTVLEATFNWPWIADLVQEVGLAAHLADPRETGRLRRGKPKNDDRDAIFLGTLFLGGAVFPEVYLAPPEVRRRRAVSRQRMLLVRVRTCQKNNIHGQLHRLGIDLSAQVSDIFSPKGRRLLQRLTLPEHEREMLEHKLGVVDVLTALIEPLEEQMHRELAQDPRAPILISLPGIAELLAYTILAEIGEIERFGHRRALAAYSGTLPLDNKSADKDFGSHTGGACNGCLRWAAIEAVTGAVRAGGPLRALYMRVRQRHPDVPGKARVAVARQIMELVWVLLTRGETYRREPPRRPGRRSTRRGSPRGGARRRDSAGQQQPAVAGTDTGRGHPTNRASQTALSSRSAAGPCGQRCSAVVPPAGGTPCAPVPVGTLRSQAAL